MARRAADHVELRHLLRSDARALQQLRHPHDAIQRRAHLMAHGREEAALGRIRMLGEAHRALALVGDPCVLEAQSQHLDHPRFAAPRFEAHQAQIDHEPERREPAFGIAAQRLERDRRQQHRDDEQHAAARQADVAEHADAGDAHERREHHRMNSRQTLGHEHQPHRAPARAVDREQRDRSTPPVRDVLVARRRTRESLYVAQANAAEHDLHEQPAGDQRGRPKRPEDHRDEDREGHAGEHRTRGQRVDGGDALVVDLAVDLGALRRRRIGERIGAVAPAACRECRVRRVDHVLLLRATEGNTERAASRTRRALRRGEAHACSRISAASESQRHCPGARSLGSVSLPKALRCKASTRLLTAASMRLTW